MNWDKSVIEWYNADIFISIDVENQLIVGKNNKKTSRKEMIESHIIIPIITSN